ncbi:hypothetical protein KSP39_PZI010760 [Platanthera zijinensis]|uniref:Uncharacterized protein n=1 Tax=Platanthera zijinensis TaxID=2320716 RepID=A0AAP0G6M7_9ASPA
MIQSIFLSLSLSIMSICSYIYCLPHLPSKPCNPPHYTEPGDRSIEEVLNQPCERLAKNHDFSSLDRVIRRTRTTTIDILPVQGAIKNDIAHSSSFVVAPTDINLGLL